MSEIKDRSKRDRFERRMVMEGKTIKHITFEEVIENHFGDYEKTKYFQSSDAHKKLEGDTYLRYHKRQDGRYELFMGGDNGEICLKVLDNPAEMQELIKLVIY
jgi:hypothetical protein